MAYGFHADIVAALRSQSKAEDHRGAGGLCRDAADRIEALQAIIKEADGALTEAEAILGGEYGDFYGPLCEQMIKLRGMIADLNK